MLFAEFTPIPPISRGNDSKRQVGSRRGVLNSVNLLEMIGELAYSLTKQIASKSDELNRLNNLVDDVQVCHLLCLRNTVGDLLFQLE